MEKEWGEEFFHHFPKGSLPRWKNSPDFQIDFPPPWGRSNLLIEVKE
jgi:hypothetical protein